MTNWKLALRNAHPEINELITLLHDADDGRRYWKDCLNANPDLAIEDPARFELFRSKYKYWNGLRLMRKAKLNTFVMEAKVNALIPEV